MTKAYQLNNIKVNYGQQCVLDVAQLDLPVGKCIALLGENGAGKSTLLHLLACIAKPTTGSITLFDQRIDLPLNTTQRQRIGFVSQQPYLFSGSVTDNIQLALKLQAIPRSQHNTLIEQVFTQLNISHLARQSAQSLSGGELKRVAIARAIVYQPDILLLDEPFSHLDQRHIPLVERCIQSFTEQAGKTVIFSTHDRLQGTALSDMTINLIAGKTTTAPLLNLFHGKQHQHHFDTGNITIQTTSDLDDAQHIAIDPREIIISTQALQSSLRNSFNGRLTSISQQQNTIHLIIDCGENFHAIISPESLTSLNLVVGETVWLSFKATAVSVF